MDPAPVSDEVDRPPPFIDVARVARHSKALQNGLGFAHIQFAVKAIPAREIIERPTKERAQFDAASRGEIELCLGQGAQAQVTSFRNTIKKAADIGSAHHAGVTGFAAAATDELGKTAENLPGAAVHLPVLVEICQADWGHSRTVGCREPLVTDLFARAVGVGVLTVGLIFHIRPADPQGRELHGCARPR